MESVLSFFLARQIFFGQGTHVFFIFVLTCLLGSLKWTPLFRVALYSTLAYALEQAFYFPLSSFLQDRCISLSFPAGLAEGLIASCYGLLSVLILPQRTFVSPGARLILCAGVLFFLVNVDRFAFHKYAFTVELLSVILAMRLAGASKIPESNDRISGQGKQTTVEKSSHAIPERTARVILIGVLLSLGACTTLALNAKGDEHILVVQGKNIWATDKIPYDDRVWTLKSAYSYSLLHQLMEQRFNLKTTTNVAEEKLKAFDAIFFMTPTSPFSKAEMKALDDFLSTGGKIVFIADHTDLYGHGRAINSFIQAYGVSVRYDAVFVPHDKHAQARLNNVLFPTTRMMTPCSISLRQNTAVLAFCPDFVAENADYTRPNFFAEMRATPDDTYGSFPLVTATKAGDGTIILCSESTIFSNFGVFAPNVLGLFDLLFCENSFAADIAAWSIPLLLLAATLLWRGCSSSGRIANFCLCAGFSLLLLVTRTFYVYQDNTQDYYAENTRFVVQADESVILEPYFETVDENNVSCSYLLSSLPRFGLHPYYVKASPFAFLFEPVPDLLIGPASLAASLKSDQKLLATTPIEQISKGGKITSSSKNISNVVEIKGQLSDYKLGNWWVQIGVSPYRKNRITSFVAWMRGNVPLRSYVYPVREESDRFVAVVLQNDLGRKKTVHINIDALNRLSDGECLLVDKEIWARKSSLNGKIVVVGGDSFNDRRNVDFFSRYWFGFVPDAE